MAHARIYPGELLAGVSADSCVLDVRTRAEFDNKALPGCLHIPLHELTPERLAAAIQSTGKNPSHIYLLCQSGKRAEVAADRLQGRTPADLSVIDGGIQGLEAAKVPLLSSGGKVISLERQVRIAAGLLVLVGVILGTWAHPGFYGLSAFVGAGLVFAGISDICAMGMLMARMPWNR